MIVHLSKFCQSVLAFFLLMLVASGSVWADSTNADRLVDINAKLQSGSSPVRIVAFGDSITGAYYHTGGIRTWSDMLKLALEKTYPKAKIEMTNAGISGHTSAQGLARIDRDVLSKKPDLVVVMFGMNDCCRATLEAFRKNMETIAQKCLDTGAAVVFSTPNTVYENQRRPTARLAQFAQTSRDVAQKFDLAMADSHAAYGRMEKGNRTEWCLLMSETIHPNLNGHRFFAELMSEAITGRPVSLADYQPPINQLAFTRAAIAKGAPVKVVAMEPYDKMVEPLLKKRFPDAKLEVVTWPTKGKTLAEIDAWAKHVRGLKPTLVLFAIPVTADAEEVEAFLRPYQWSLAQCLAFSAPQWDFLPITANVTATVPETSKCHHDRLARQIFLGYDYRPLDRSEGDTRSAEAILDEFVEKNLKQ